MIGLMKVGPTSIFMDVVFSNLFQLDGVALFILQLNLEMLWKVVDGFVGWCIGFCVKCKV